MAPEKILQKIETMLSNVDPQEASFDFASADRCKAALARIADKAARLCGEIRAEPSRTNQKPTGRQFDYERMATGSALMTRKEIVYRGPIEFVRRKS